MKVVKEGQVSKPLRWDRWKVQVVCNVKDEHDPNGCGAVLEVMAKDLVMMYWKGGFRDHHYTAVRCPRCGKYNRILYVPENVLEKVNTAKSRGNAIFDGFSDRDSYVD